MRRGNLLTTKLNYMYEFEKHEKLTEFIQEMANTGKAPREWTTFIETLNQALRLHDGEGRSELSSSLRDKFAMEAMNSELVTQGHNNSFYWANEIQLAERSYLIADAMLKARSNKS